MSKPVALSDTKPIVEIDGSNASEATVPHWKSKDDRRLAEHAEVLSTRILGYVFWAYVIINTFVASVDNWVAEKLPKSLTWLVDYKLLIVIFAFIVMWRLSTKQRFRFYFVYFLLFPIWQVLGAITRLFMSQSWPAFIAVANALAYFYHEAYRIVIILSGFIFAGVLSIYANSNIAVIAAMFIAGLTLTATYYSAILAALWPSRPLETYVRLADSMRSATSNDAIEEADENSSSGSSFISIEKLSKEDRPAQISRIEASLLFNRGCLFFALKMRDFQSSGWRIVPSILGIVGLIIGNLLLFTFFNLSLYKYQPTEFMVVEEVTSFDFLYYSFNNIIFNSVANIEPFGTLAKLAYMVQTFAVLLIALIFAGSLFAHRNESYKLELEGIVKRLRKHALETEDELKQRYGFDDMDNAMKALENAKSGMMTVIVAISSKLND